MYITTKDGRPQSAPVVLGFVLLESRTEYPLTPYRQQCSHNHGSQKQANEAKSSKASKNSNRCLGTRESLHVLCPAGSCDIARDPANGRRRDRNHATLVRDAAAAFNLLQYAARFLPVRLVPIALYLYRAWSRFRPTPDGAKVLPESERQGRLRIMAAPG